MVSRRNLLTDYGAITKADMTDARGACAKGTQGSCQKVLMMYQYIYAMLTDKAKTQLIGQSIPSYGPTLFYTVVHSTSRQPSLTPKAQGNS